MSETITLHSEHPEVVRGLAKDSSVLCTQTSAPDVYVHVITKADTAELHKGDGTVIPKMTRTRFRVFRSNTGDDPFSATVAVTDLPAAASSRSDVLMSAFSLVKHKAGCHQACQAQKGGQDDETPQIQKLITISADRTGSIPSAQTGDDGPPHAARPQSSTLASYRAPLSVQEVVHVTVTPCWHFLQTSTHWSSAFGL